MSKKGFSLIELMVAIIIIAVALLALAQSRISSDRTAFGASLSRDATSLSQDVFEELRNRDFDNVLSGSDNVGNITRTWVVNDVDPHLKEVVLTIQWPQAGEIRSTTFTTHITRH